MECGWFIGYWPYGNHGVFNSFTMYMTLNGGSGPGYLGNSIPGGSLMAMHATNKYNCVWTGNSIPYTQINVGYSVSSGNNYAQGEVTNSTQTYMGGGGGEYFNAYWSPDGDTWNLWGWIHICAQSPYWINSPNSYTYNNGGY